MNQLLWISPYLMLKMINLDQQHGNLTTHQFVPNHDFRAFWQSSRAANQAVNAAFQLVTPTILKTDSCKV
jgi:hypothetical protein